jgi:N-methylhydantoinase A
MLRIGIDTGGTFTDFVVLDGNEISVFKLSSTPAQPEKAVLDGIARTASGKKELLLQHGSTVATNALLERKGAKCALVTNEGFEDIIEIGRQNRPGLYRFSPSRPEALVPHRLRIGLRERTLWDGSQLIPLENKSLEWLKSRVEQLKPESVAVALLYSYLNPENELRIGEALAEFEVPVSLSHQILPEFREYERTSTTTINAYVRPIMSRYLTALGEDDTVRKSRLTIMQSNGGTILAESAKKEPVRTLFSGPAGGVVGAFEIAQQSGYSQIISFDMGGTSTDVCLCNGSIDTTNEATIDYLPVSIQMIGIHTVGAGGGSIAWVDEGGLLKVGPRSAGAMPGPICYGKGSEITVTDANLYLGRLDPDYFLGGDLPLYPEKIEAALRSLGTQVDGASEKPLEPREIAEGIVRIANTQMESALRVISLDKGYDTRSFTLVTFGGAGGLHACDLARSLLIPRVLVPLHPGAMSAMGILRSDIVQDVSVTEVLSTVDEKLASKLKDKFHLLSEQITAKMADQGFSVQEIEIEKSVDARYLGQSFEINIPFSDKVIDEFHKLHEQYYGYSNPRLPVETVNLRVRGRSRLPLPELQKVSLEEPGVSRTALIQEKHVTIEGQSVLTSFFMRDKLKAGNVIPGPAVILEYSATTLIPADFQGKVDQYLNLVIEPKVG